MLVAGPFAGVDGDADEPKVAYDSLEFTAWANGYQDYVVGTDCHPDWQTPDQALGPATTDVMDIVCLGNGGRITLTFDQPIRDGEGWDFAVFENSFNDNFLELAFVEVSTDGSAFVRFDSCSLTAGAIGGFGLLDPTNFTGLAGKYKGGFGLGFDLAALAGKAEVVSGQVRLGEIRYVRIVDIVGDGATLDQRSAAWAAEYGPNGPIYDPHPTTDSGGFDLDAVGVRHVAEPGFQLSRASLSVDEPGGEGTFTVVLTGPPDSDVVLNAASTNSSLADASPMTLTFTPSNWFTAQTVTVTGVDNTDVGDNPPVNIAVSVNAAASDDKFDGLMGQMVAVTVTNDDFTLTLAVAGDGGLDVGAGDHVLGAHNQPFTITAIPDPRRLFTGWTGGGEDYSIDNPLTICCLAEDLALTANFAAYYLLRYAAGSNGSLSGPALQTVIAGDDGATVTAMPDPGHHFVEWSDALTDNPRQDTSVAADLAVTATLAINVYTVVFRTDGTRGATVNGAAAVTDAVAHGSTSIAVTAAAPAGLEFSGWTGDCVGAAATISVAEVTADMTIVANFGRSVAVGSVFAVLSGHVFDPDEEFTAAPKIAAAFVNPVTGKPGKATAKVLTKPTAEAPAPSLACEWTKKIKLFSAKEFGIAQKGGTVAAEWLAEPGRQAPLAIDLLVSTKQNGIVAQPLFRTPLRPPVIVGPPEDGGVDADGNRTLILRGLWFGAGKPKIWREYRNAKDEIKRQACKVLAPDGEFRNLKDKPVHMDPATGESKVAIVVPGKAPKGTLLDTLVLDNGVGMDTVGLP